ncbi:ArsC/Spx/MgsR family protein [Lactococcus garvieae]|uniref:ArsC/Spx/MgsR family protein n=1 Tax=Lactococcus garvieae TaxID=1363 RepID=UPI00398E7433
MIIYYRSGCYSSIKSLKWLEVHGVLCKKSRIEQVTKENLLKIVALTDNGIMDLLKRKADPRTQSKIEDIQEMSFNQVLEYLSHHSELLRTPILVSQDKLLIG